MTPKVSVLMPVRNGLPWLHASLESLAAQTFADFEILALEDGSTDGTRDCLDAWNDDRLRVIPTGGVGISAALNVGLAAAAAPLVARQDADDLSAAERLQSQVEYLRVHSDIGVLATAAEYIDGRGQTVDNEWVRTVRRQQDAAVTPDQIRDLMPLTCCLTHGSVMARTAVLREAGGYAVDAAPAEDYDLWLRLLPRTPMAKLPQRLYTYRIHENQVSAQRREQQLQKTLTAKFDYVRRVCPGMPRPARLVVVGGGRGADCYRALAPAHGFDVVAPSPVQETGEGTPLESLTDGCSPFAAFDAVVIADFADVDAYRRAVDADAATDVVRIGNFFVPRRWARGDSAACVA